MSTCKTVCDLRRQRALIVRRMEGRTGDTIVHGRYSIFLREERRTRTTSSFFFTIRLAGRITEEYRSLPPTDMAQKSIDKRPPRLDWRAREKILCPRPSIRRNREPLLNAASKALYVGYEILDPKKSSSEP